MARYIPIPPVSIDPRNEAELLNAALTKVFQASNGTINDFTSGSPITALLEGQVYAQGELLYHLNRLPNAVITEWIGPFLGSMRQAGAASTAQIKFTIEVRNDPYVVESGFGISTTANLANGIDATFLTDTTLIIPPGEGEGTVSATCTILGSEGNVPAGSLNRYTSNLAGLVSVSNLDAASGGLDVETLEEVRQRFYSLIRRPNPVSKEDWESFFIDLFGLGTVVSTVPRRSSQYEPLSPSDEYGHVSFFLLKPDTTKPSSEDIQNINNLIKVSCPNEFEAHVYPIELNDVDIFASFKYNADLGFTRNVETLASTLRGYLSNVFVPDAYWETGYSPTVGDIQGALVNQIGSYTSPDVTSLSAYFPPRGVGKNILNPSKISSFVASEAINAGDLIQQGTTYYPTIIGFSPEAGTQSSSEVQGNLTLSPIRQFDSSVGSYSKGDVIQYSGAYYVVSEDFQISPLRSFESYQNAQIIESTARVLQVWAAGLSLTTADLVLATATDFTTTVDIVSQPLAWVPVSTFSVPTSTTSLANAQASNFVAAGAATVSTAVDGTTYTAGEYIQLQQTDALRGVVTITYRVDSTFTYSNTQDFSVAVTEVSVFSDTIFSTLSYRYQPRFSIGEYLQDKSTGVYYQALKNFTPYTQLVDTMVTDRYLLAINFTPTSSREIFRIITGDVVSLVEGRVTKQYESLKNFTPVFEASVYTDEAEQFLVERNDIPSSTVEFFDSSYNVENIVYSEVSGGLKFFRTMKPFTAPVSKNDFTGTLAPNSARIEELSGNLLQVVVKSSCNEKIYSRTGDGTSLNSLGHCNFNFIPDNGLQFVTQIVIEEDGNTSYSPSLKNITPIDYGEGTFAL